MTTKSILGQDLQEILVGVGRGYEKDLREALALIDKLELERARLRAWADYVVSQEAHLERHQGYTVAARRVQDYLTSGACRSECHSHVNNFPAPEAE